MGLFNTLLDSGLGIASGGLTSAVGSSNIFDSITSGGATGSAGVTFENDRNSGAAQFHGKTLTMKWRGADGVLKLGGYPNGLTGFGWSQGKTPRSAQAIFKKAENAFFIALSVFLQKVRSGTETIPPDWGLSEPEDLNVFGTLTNATGVGAFISGVSDDIFGNSSNNSAETGLKPKNNTMTYLVIAVILFFIFKKR